MLRYLFKDKQTDTEQSINILFIGNSLTKVNNLPRTFKRLAESDGNIINYSVFAYDGWTLKKHLSKVKVLRALRNKSWDYVILQEQSFRPTSDTKCFYDSVRKFNTEIKQSSAAVVLFQNWEVGGNTLVEIENVYNSIADSLGIIIAPFGRAWKKANSKYKLYKDKVHPTAIAQYLNACTLYATIFHKSPNGLSNLGFSKTDAQELQEIAWDSVNL